MAKHYRKLLPLRNPGVGEQFAFAVNLDQCTGCKACVVACHSLNGLDDSESWRDVGLLLAQAPVPMQQTITTACHHCAEPACSDGCPVLAYEKDEETGIVRHLDDQCIGCSYCILKCPYDVPKFNLKRGIVRKCDMCVGRLKAGEAPACVQACPNGAIAITVVAKRVSSDPLLPGLISNSYTQPQTVYTGKAALSASAQAADASVLRVEPGHWPLAIMLVLTQMALGAWLAVLERSAPVWLPWLAFTLGLLGVLASVAHLGQPLKAWRAFLGWRKSWLSREVMAFGAFVGMGAGVLLGLLPLSTVQAAGVLSVVCSIMVYVDTRRAFWAFPATAGKFLATSIITACFLANQPFWAAVALSVKLLAELGYMAVGDSKSAKLLRGPLRQVFVARCIFGLLAVVLAGSAPLAALVAFGFAELLERSYYFKAVVAYRMPGL